jgi:hypothetical protein
MGSGGINPCFLVLGTRWRGDTSFRHWPLHPQVEKDFHYPLNRMVVGFQYQSGRFDKKFLATVQN